jgi:teichuronic acid biosynthesis glycosyltransferase TuaC
MPEALRILITKDAGRTADGVVLSHPYATQVEFLRKAGLSVTLFGVDDRTSPQGILRNIRELKNEISSCKPDLVVTYYGTMLAAISRLAAGSLPFVVTFRGSDLLGSANPGWKWRLRDGFGHRLSIWAANGSRQIIVNGSGLLHALPGRLQPRAHNLPNGINTQVFSPIPPEIARQRLGWPLGEKVILFNAGTGSGQVVKNLPLAENVLSILKHRLPQVRLEIISTCTREEVCLRMNACDCLLVTSLHEGSPDLVKEGMACNLPVVSVPCGDVLERLQNVSCSSIQPYDASLLANALEKVLHACQRSNGREQLILQGLDIPSVTQRVLSVYHQAVFSPAVK